MTRHQWGRPPFLVIRQTELVQTSFSKTPRFFAHGKSQDLTPSPMKRHRTVFDAGLTPKPCEESHAH